MTSKQLVLIRKRGGARCGSGRKKQLPKDIQNHLPRENLTGKHPLHVNFRLRDGLSCLRHKTVFQVFKAAIARAREKGFRVNHFSILGNHGHLIVEVESNKQLESLMKIITIRLALRVKRLILTKGRIFRDRYFLHVLKTPTEVKRALAYVLLNEQSHRLGNARRIKTLVLNSYSSSFAFQKWNHLLGRNLIIRGFVDNLIDVSPPRTWLLQKGWMKV